MRTPTDNETRGTFRTTAALDLLAYDHLPPRVRARLRDMANSYSAEHVFDLLAEWPVARMLARLDALDHLDRSEHRWEVETGRFAASADA